GSLGQKSADFQWSLWQRAAACATDCPQDGGCPQAVGSVSSRRGHAEIPTRRQGGGQRKTAALGASAWWGRRSLPSASRAALGPQRSASFAVVCALRRLWAVRPAPCAG